METNPRNSNSNNKKILKSNSRIPLEKKRKIPKNIPESMTRKSDRGMKVQLTDSFDDVREDDAIGDVIGQVADSPLGFDLVQIVIGPLGVDLNQSERGISLVRSTDGYLHEP